MIGFLSPDGEFIECESWEHTSKASEICESKYSAELSGIQAEDYILAKGFLVIRARDVYMSFWDEKKAFKYLSDKQIEWLSSHTDELNNMQKEDLNDILLDNKHHREMMERYWQKQ